MRDVRYVLFALGSCCVQASHLSRLVSNSDWLSGIGGIRPSGAVLLGGGKISLSCESILIRYHVFKPHLLFLSIYTYLSRILIFNRAMPVQSRLNRTQAISLNLCSVALAIAMHINLLN